jgi:lactate dehydrogenase-like 2-hydroxyacid dehydrogenase
MKIAVLEKIETTNEQKERLKKLGEVSFYDNSTEEESKQRVKDADVVIVDWVDPSWFMLSMKKPSLLAMLTTGYTWIKNLSEARAKGILVSNIPNYSTEAVAEHLIGLSLAVARQTLIGDKNIRAGIKKNGYLRGFELKNKRMGIIGLGDIGKRVSEIANAFGMEVVAYNRSPKKVKNVKKLLLDDVLKTSDVVCVCCSLNDSSKGMIDKKKLSLVKSSSIIVSCVWDVINLDDLISALQTKNIMGAGLDVAIEGNMNIPDKLSSLDNVVLTPHIGYNTTEAMIRRIDTCISNIENFKKGKPSNIVN